MIWEGPKTRDGYGLAEVGDLYNDGKRHRTLAHRAVWWRAHGKPADDVTIHHWKHCDRLCVNLEHLHPMAKADHDEHHKRLDTCKRGHDRTDPENVWVDAKGNRHCRPCWRERRAERKRGD